MTRQSPATPTVAQRVRAQGRDILDLTVGEPDADTPEHIKQAAIAAIAAGETNYTPVNGTPALRAAIIDKFESRTGIRYHDTEIAVGGGAKQVIFMAFTATVDNDAEVIIPAPYWVSYPDMVLVNDGTPRIVSCTEDQDFKLTADDLSAAITDRTRWVIINAPSNPTGAAYTATELRELADVLLQHPNVLVLTDEIYDEVWFGSEPVPHLVSIEPALRERVLMVNGVSKSYAMTGWRLGYAAGPSWLITAINTLQSQSSSCPSSISQAAAVAALTGDQQFISDSVEIYRERKDLAVKLLSEVPRLTVRNPHGAFYLYINCADTIDAITPKGEVITDDRDFVMYLLEEAGVATIHGGAYGASPYFRISFATSNSIIEQACERISQACAALS
jgi:aspartate aminotransferase